MPSISAGIIFYAVRNPGRPLILEPRAHLSPWPWPWKSTRRNHDAKRRSSVMLRKGAYQPQEALIVKNLETAHGPFAFIPSVAIKVIGKLVI